MRRRRGASLLGHVLDGVSQPAFVSEELVNVGEMSSDDYNLDRTFQIAEGL